VALAPTQPILTPFGAVQISHMTNLLITYNPYLYTEPTHHLNMHQTMTEKVTHDRGIAYLIIRQQHPPPGTIGLSEPDQ
jgi:hypothetical protein